MKTKRIWATEHGYTVFEVLVVVAVLSAAMSAVMLPMMVSQRTEARNINYDYAQQAERTGLDSMVIQIRQAYNILATSGNSIDFDIYLNGVAYRVYYECDVPQPNSSYRECMRLQVPAGSSLPALSTGKVVIQNVINGTSADPVFTFAPDPEAPYYMTATIRVPASGGTKSGFNHTISFSDGALMRNENVGN
jgi:type II secretory pathway pseudopilin PulG